MRTSRWQSISVSIPVSEPRSSQADFLTILIIDFWRYERQFLHESAVNLFLVGLVTDVDDVGGEVVLGMIVDDVAYVGKYYLLEYVVLQVFQEPAGNIKHLQITASAPGITFSFPLYLSSYDLSPLADLVNLQDVGEEGVPFADDDCFCQLPVLHKVFNQNAKGPQVGGLRGQDLKHALVNLQQRTIISVN